MIRMAIQLLPEPRWLSPRMRTLPVSICACLVGVMAMPLGARIEQRSPSDLTVILDFKGPLSHVSVKEMEREADLVLKSSGVRLEWRILGEDPSAAYNDLVVITFRGSCQYDPAPPRYDESGPLALTRITDGEILPFGEVDCTRVASSVRYAMSRGDYARADQLVGRAMGRVVAHELVHMLTGSRRHGADGVGKAALSGKQLIEESLPLSAFDIDRLKQLAAR
jgi:hypothetical protein